MQNALSLGWLWLVHVLLTIPVVAPTAWLARRRITWHRWELLMFVVPFGLWLALMFSNWRPKTLANLGECVFISMAICVAIVIRAGLGSLRESRRVPTLLLSAVSVIAVAVYFATPMWPE